MGVGAGLRAGRENQEKGEVGKREERRESERDRESERERKEREESTEADPVHVVVPAFRTDKGELRRMHDMI